MAWVKAAWIPVLFSAFNTIAPNRSKASDGTIGDTAHQGSASGHNPDDTPGSKPEREDSDNIAEVRAADVTSNLRATVTMETVIQRILRTPAERDRLIYIIYNRRIWRKSNGWREERYTGSDPHDTHAHLSGDPASDNDSGLWTSITGATAPPTTGDNMAGRLLVIRDNTGQHWACDGIWRFAVDAGTASSMVNPNQAGAYLGTYPTILNFGTTPEGMDSWGKDVASAGGGDVTLDAQAVVDAMKSDPEFRAVIVAAVNEAEDS